MLAPLVFGIALLASLATIQVLGVRVAALATPVVLGGAFYVLPGPTAAFLPLSGAWMAAGLLFLGRSTMPHQGLDIRGPAGAFLLVMLGMALVLLWSPDKAQGLRIVIQGSLAAGVGLITVLALRTLSVNLVMGVFLAVGIVLAGAVTVFRFVPELERAYLNSFIAPLLIERSALRPVILGFWEKGNNILDPVKSGAVFLNANVASVYLSMMVAAASALVIRYPRAAWPKVVAFMLAVGVMATGSRTGLLALITLPLVLAAATHQVVPTRRVIALTAAALLVVGVAIVLRPDLVTRLSVSVVTRDERFLLWPLAAQRILDAPLLGGGFGDWEAWLGNRFQAMGVGRVLPPHNLLLHLALWGGIVLVGAFGFFLWILIREHLRLIRTDRRHAPYAAAGLGMVYVVCLHAMLDNFFLFEWRIGPTAAALLACTLSPARGIEPDPAR